MADYWEQQIHLVESKVLCSVYQQRNNIVHPPDLLPGIHTSHSSNNLGKDQVEGHSLSVQYSAH